MKLTHAASIAAKFLREQKVAERVPTGEEQIAVDVLVSFARSAHAARGPMRTVMRALHGADDLNQQDLGLDGDKT